MPRAEIDLFFPAHEEYAISEALKRNLSQVEIELRMASPYGDIGKELREQMHIMMKGIDQVSVNTGINREDIRAVIYGLADEDIFNDRFPQIAEELSFTEQRISHFKRSLPSNKSF